MHFPQLSSPQCSGYPNLSSGYPNSTRQVCLSSGEILQISESAYSATTINGLQPEMLSAVTSGMVPALHIKNAVSTQWCDLVTNRFTRHPETRKEDVVPSIYSLGTHLYSCPRGESLTYYFQKVEQSNAAIEEILPHGRDPMVTFLKEACDLNGAGFEYLTADELSIRHGSLRMWGKGSGSKEDGRCYFAVPHEDYEETNDNHRLPQIYQSNNVYSIVLCIDAVHDREPETIVWNRRMTLEETRDPRNRHSWASYGYRESLLQDVDSMLIRLSRGDAAIIPAHNVHAVVGYPGFQRCTYMAFFHLIKPTQNGFQKLIFRT
jgi:hypothetical protein